MKNKLFILAALIVAAVTNASAQTAEVKISLNEQFFDALFAAVFTHLEEPSVPISGMADARRDDPDAAPVYRNAAFDPAPEAVCPEAITLKKEMDGVRTAVRFRDGKILAPIAFHGNYNPPLIGCVEFRGWAETNVELKFDERRQALVGYARVLNVNLSGTGGVGSGLLARFVQNSIDQKVNPLEIVTMDKLSFLVPVQKAGNLRMKAVGMRHAVNERSLDIILRYRFEKG